MMTMFLGSHVRWNMSRPPASNVSAFNLRCKILPPKIVQQIQSTLHIPLEDDLEQLCLLPDTEDGGITYDRLFGALHEYFETRDLDEYPEFGGLIVVGDRCILNRLPVHQDFI